MALPLLSTNAPLTDVDPAGFELCEDCGNEFAAAQREMGAFVLAVEELYGNGVAARAAAHWVDLIEEADLSPVDGRSDWRRITILASSRLAIKESFDPG